MTYFKEARVKIGINQEQMAAALRVHRQNISNWERGLTTMPPKYIEKMRRFLTLKEFKAFVESYSAALKALAEKRIDKRLAKYVR